MTDAFLSPQIFEDLQSRIDEDAEVKDAIRDILRTLERQERLTQSTLSKVHNTPSSQLAPVLAAAHDAIQKEVQSVKSLSEVANKFPYYKYNGMWTKDVQGAIFAILFCSWLGGMNVEGKQPEVGRLLTIEEVGQVMCVPVNLKLEDAFHITIEEYLHALITLIEELGRLATNSVTLGDYSRPTQIANFTGELHAGFQILNLKNDSLRRRSDGIKYQIKKVEEVVYDLTIRGLISKAGQASAASPQPAKDLKMEDVKDVKEEL